MKIRCSRFEQPWGSTKSPERCRHLSGEAITQSVEKLEMSLGGLKSWWDHSLFSCILLRMRCMSAGEAFSRDRFAFSKERSDSTSGDSGCRGAGFSENTWCSKIAGSSGPLAVMGPSARSLSLTGMPVSLRAFFMLT